MTANRRDHAEDEDAPEGDGEDSLLGELPAEGEAEGEGDREAAAEPETPTVVPPPASSRAIARGLITPVRDPLERFLAEARRYPRLSDEEERRLGTAVRTRGDMDAAKK